MPDVTKLGVDVEATGVEKTVLGLTALDAAAEKTAGDYDIRIDTIFDMGKLIGIEAELDGLTKDLEITPHFGDSDALVEISGFKKYLDDLGKTREIEVIPHIDNTAVQRLSLDPLLKSFQQILGIDALAISTRKELLKLMGDTHLELTLGDEQAVTKIIGFNALLDRMSEHLGIDITVTDSEAISKLLTLGAVSAATKSILDKLPKQVPIEPFEWIPKQIPYIKPVVPLHERGIPLPVSGGGTYTQNLARLASQNAQARAGFREISQLIGGIPDHIKASVEFDSEAAITKVLGFKSLLNSIADKKGVDLVLNTSSTIGVDQLLQKLNPDLELKRIVVAPEARAALAALLETVKVDVNVNDGVAVAKISGFKELMAGVTRTLGIDVVANDQQAIASMLSLSAISKTLEGTVKIPVEVTGAGTAAAELVALNTLAKLAKESTGGAGKSLLPTAAMLGFGGLLGMAQIGSVGGLAGFGPEHAITVAVSMIGSAIGAMIGGAILAITALSVAAVGFGTDLAGIGQAAGDIKGTYKALTGLNTAVQQYGAYSSQANAAQGTLNTTLQGFSPVARQAVLHAATLAIGLHQLFNTATGSAENIGAKIIAQFMTVAGKFIPIIGKFATQNMGIIQKNLQPLLSWIQSPGKQGGVGIFNELERQFQKTLPTAIHAVTQAIELFAKTVGLVAPQTGHVIAAIDKFLTRMNSTSGFKKWGAEVENLIRLFHIWVAFFKILIEDIFLIFHRNAGLGQNVIQTLTADLAHLHTVLKSISGGAALHNLFSVHKEEVIALIQAIVQLGVVFVKVYLIAAPVMVRLATDIIKAVTAIVGAINKIPGGVGSVIVGFAFLGTRSALLGGILLSLVKKFATFVVASGDATGASVLMRGALIALSTVALFVVITAVVLLVQHFGLLRGLIYAGVIPALVVLTGILIGFDAIPVVLAVSAIVIAIAALVAGVIEIVKHWRLWWSEMRNSVAGKIVLFILQISSPIFALIKGMQLLKHLWNDVFGGTTAQPGQAAAQVYAASHGGPRSLITQGYPGAPPSPKILSPVPVKPLPPGVFLQHGLFGIPPSNVVTPPPVISEAVKQVGILDRAAFAATQYKRALNGIFPVTGLMNGTRQLLLVSQSIGNSLAGLVTGTQKFTVTAADSANQMINNLIKQHRVLTHWAQDAQKALKDGVDRWAVAAVAAQSPQDLATLAKMTKAQIAAFNKHWEQQKGFISAVSGPNGVLHFDVKIPNIKPTIQNHFEGLAPQIVRGMQTAFAGTFMMQKVAPVPHLPMGGMAMPRNPHVNGTPLPSGGMAMPRSRSIGDVKIYNDFNVVASPDQVVRTMSEQLRKYHG